MYVLQVSVDYEGGSLLGLYSSMDTAMVSAQRYMETEDMWDTLALYLVTVDAEPLDSLFRDPVWSQRR